MNNRIIADTATMKRVTDAKPGDKSVYVNMDAIRELPEEYEVVLTKIEFDQNKLDEKFSNVAGEGKTPIWMPTPQLMYKIADACGISGGLISTSEPIIQEIDVNPLLCKKMEDAPTLQKKIVGYRSIKQSERQQEDGTFLPSSKCIIDFNAWERCLLIWSNEEMWTEGYTKPNKFENKYNNKWKRQKHFQEVLKFAQKITQTQAHEKTIRELAGLTTGYSTADLKDGCLVFAKVRRSAMVLKLETAARVDAIRRGIPQETKSQELLFGSKERESIHNHLVDSGIELVDLSSKSPTPEPDFPDTDAPPPEPPKTAREEMLTILRLYKKDDTIPSDKKDTSEKMIKWLDKTSDAESNADLWGKCVKNLAAIEAQIPEVGRYSHRKF